MFGAIFFSGPDLHSMCVLDLKACFQEGIGVAVAAIFCTYNVNDLLQGDSKGEHERVRLVHHRALQVVVETHEVVEQLLLVVPANGFCVREDWWDIIRHFLET